MNILSLISRGPIRLTALMKETGRGFTDLYRELERLERDGLITITPGGFNESALIQVKGKK